MFFYNSKLNLSHGFYFTSLKTTNEVKCCMEWDIAFMLLKIKRRTSCQVEFCMFALLFSSIILFESSQIFPEQVLLKRKCQEKTFQGSDRHFQVCSNFISHVCTPLNISCYNLKTQVYWNCLSVKCRVPNIIWHVELITALFFIILICTMTDLSILGMYVSRCRQIAHILVT